MIESFQRREEVVPVIDSKNFPIQVDGEITLKLAELEDAEVLFELVEENRAYLQEWLSWVPDVKSVADQKESIRQGIQGLAKGRGIALNIIYLGEIVGCIGVHSIYLPYQRGEITYWLAKSATRTGIATRSCEALIRYAFEILGLHRIEIRCVPENTRSSAIPKRLGFTYEGTLKEAVLLNGCYVDQEVYRLLEQEWHK